MNFMVFMVMMELFFFAYVVSFHLSGCDDGLPTDVVFGLDERQLEIGGLEEIEVFGSLSDRSGG